MLSKIREYLYSDDLEMVKLGVILMQDQVPPSEWKDLLDEASKLETKSSNNSQYSYTLLGKKWYFTIDNDNIKIIQDDNMLSYPGISMSSYALAIVDYSTDTITYNK